MRRVQVTEVLSRSDQGRTRPFLCRCDDGNSYWVKGRSAGRVGLAAEVIAARMGAELELPIPEPVIAVVPEELVAEAVGNGLDELGAGPAFGSRLVTAVEFKFTRTEHVDPELAEAIAVFDWWIRNEDRTLTELGGNPNLLWQISPDEGLFVIDHNLAFGEFNPSLFLDTHVFAQSFSLVATDFEARDRWSQRLSAALRCWPEARALVPPEWRFIDFEQTVPSNLDLNVFLSILEACRAGHFWTLP